MGETPQGSEPECRQCQKCGASLTVQLLEEALHPAGGINNKFVYEPIGSGEYAYKTVDGSRGIAKVDVEYEDEKNKKYPRWFTAVDGEPYFSERSHQTHGFSIYHIEKQLTVGLKEKKRRLV